MKAFARPILTVPAPTEDPDYQAWVSETYGPSSAEPMPLVRYEATVAVHCNDTTVLYIRGVGITKQAAKDEVITGARLILDAADRLNAG